MSLDVPPALLERARAGEVDNEEFVACIKSSLPYAWELVEELVARTRETGATFADNRTAPPDDAAQGQLLRAMSSDSMRAAMEEHFGVRIAFQNCHRVAVFTSSASEEQYRTFKSRRAQLLNQSPELVNC
ncbi:SCO5389 family protein [Nonomuraea sp. NPDC050556]|uniref:SCO5389 family protein n=1 Tax=Nonomuraea sp. NPDC050556 TaxID=3364369 RepID=UPI00379D2232